MCQPRPFFGWWGGTPSCSGEREAQALAPCACPPGMHCSAGAVSWPQLCCAKGLCCAWISCQWYISQKPWSRLVLQFHCVIQVVSQIIFSLTMCRFCIYDLTYLRVNCEKETKFSFSSRKSLEKGHLNISKYLWSMPQCKDEFYSDFPTLEKQTFVSCNTPLKSTLIVSVEWGLTLSCSCGSTCVNHICHIVLSK